MKVLAFSDLHGSIPSDLLDEFEDSDLVLNAGDWLSYGSSSVNFFPFEKIDKTILSVAGNIDPLDLLERLPSVEDVHLKRKEFNGYFVVGISATHFPSISDEDFEKLKELVSKSPRRTIVLSHYPPKGVLDETNSGENVGDEKLRKLIEECEPLVFLCGHIHEARGKTEFSGTDVVNLGPEGAILNLEDDGIQINMR